MATYDSTGLSVDSYDEQFSELVALLQNAFGDNVKVSPDSVFGQTLAIFALGLTEHAEILQYIADAYNPQAASGTALSNLVLLNGIQRNASAYSTVTLTCTANAAGCTIPAGSIASDAAGYNWATDAELVVSASSSDTVSATCTELGAVAAAAGTITTITTPIYGWASVTNAAAAIEGQSEETDSALRARRNVVAERASTVSTSAIYAAISDVSGVEAVKVVENATDTTSADGVPPQHIWCIVYGGASADIAEAIWTHKAAGIGTYGASSASYADPITGDSYTVNFERPTDVNWYVTVNLTADDDYPTDGDALIETALEDYADTLSLGSDIILSRLYTPINTVAGHTVDSLYIGTSPSPAGTTDIAMADYQRPVLAAVVVNS